MLLAASLAPLGSTMIAVALPRIGRDIGVEVSDLTPWLVTSYLIASIALQSPGGKLGDLIGHGRAIVVGLSVVALGSAIGLFGGDAHTLGAARILMASGGAATVPATMAILRNQTAAARRARIFGLFGAVHGTRGRGRAAGRRRIDAAVRMARRVRRESPRRRRIAAARDALAGGPTRGRQKRVRPSTGSAARCSLPASR